MYYFAKYYFSNNTDMMHDYLKDEKLIGLLTQLMAFTGIDSNNVSGIDVRDDVEQLSSAGLLLFRRRFTRCNKGYTAYKALKEEAARKLIKRAEKVLPGSV